MKSSLNPRAGIFFTTILFTLFFIFGCGSDNPTVDNKDDKEQPDFSGNWNIHEALEGCNETFEKDYPIEIKQNGNSATLEVGAQNYIDCTVTNQQLQCGGDLSLESGGYFDYSIYNLSYSGDDLTGEGSWTYYDAESRSCSGISDFSATPGSTPPPETPNFTGTWVIYEEQESDTIYNQYRYTIDIEQTGTTATISKDNQQMTCNVVDQDLVCEGSFFYENFYKDEELDCSFDSYRLRSDGNNGLTGEASWSVTSYQGSVWNGESNLTTTRPEVGSFSIWNRSNVTVLRVNYRPCGSYDWGENRLSDTMNPDDEWVFFNIQSGCYDIQACDDLVLDTNCADWDNQTVIGGETLVGLTVVPE